VHQVRAYPRGSGKRRPEEVPCLSAGSTATRGRQRKDDDITELLRNDLDSHDWAARAAEALEQAKKLPPGLQRFEAIRKAAQLRIAADMKRLVDGERANGVMQQGAALVTDDASPSPLKDGELHEQLST
jgi:hypothetical protein